MFTILPTVRTICFTSSGSHGGCWIVLVVLFLCCFLKKWWQQVTEKRFAGYALFRMWVALSMGGWGSVANRARGWGDYNTLQLFSMHTCRPCVFQHSAAPVHVAAELHLLIGALIPGPKSPAPGQRNGTCGLLKATDKHLPDVLLCACLCTA